MSPNGDKVVAGGDKGYDAKETQLLSYFKLSAGGVPIWIRVYLHMGGDQVAQVLNTNYLMAIILIRYNSKLLS